MLEVLAILAGIIGIFGSIIPGLPGPPISWVGLLLVFLATGTMSSTFLLVWLGVTLVVTILDYVIPSMLTRAAGGSKIAGRGAIAGLLVGMFVPPVGIVVGTLGGAFLAELLIADKGVWASFKASLGAFLGFIFGTGIKLACSGVMMFYIIKLIA